ncbi:MAG: AbrB/MazE/SpoVT family DNA-binding domain-containing protein [Candidatus Omnitrophica bacterium]|nr:AbrB/MazE/SpoVT family DNA-binding domain-containing protein [Candidatus Omnitrophota bacterium]
MAISKVTRNYQITIPAMVRELLHVQVGSLVDFIVKKGQVILKPKALVDEDQSWFWSKEWQEGEREVEESKRKGRGMAFKNVQEMRRHFAK